MHRFNTRPVGNLRSAEALIVCASGVTGWTGGSLAAGIAGYTRVIVAVGACFADDGRSHIYSTPTRHQRIGEYESWIKIESPVRRSRPKAP
jgi:hypothetical protein